MKYLISVFLTLVAFSAFSQNYSLEATAPTVTPGATPTFSFTVRIKATGADFLLGTSNIRYSYNNAALNTAVVPLIVTNYLPAYTVTSTKSLASGVYYGSINPTVGVTPAVVTSAGIDIARISIPVTDPTQLANLRFRLFSTVTSGAYSTSLPTAIAGNSTKLNNTAGTPLVADGPSTELGNLASAPLPVTISSFTANEKGSANEVQWATEIEENLKNFEVEKSNDSKNWTKLATVLPNMSQRYATMDLTPFASTYYRLRSIDKDGREDISNVIVVNRKTGKFTLTNVSPNPTADNIYVKFETAENVEVMISVSDIFGRVVASQKANATTGFNAANIELSQIPAGPYFLNINDGINTLTQRIIKQ
jgi:hypothetical protein